MSKFFNKFHFIIYIMIMRNIFNKETVATLIFLIGIVLSLFGQLHPEIKILTWLLLAVSMIYLFLGWFMFKAYFPGGHPALLFVMGYSYSGVFIGSVFSVSKWPFAVTMMAGAVFWVLVQSALVIVLRKKMPEKGLIQFLIEASLMLVMTVLQIIRY
jgi:hypothetical protein